MASVPPCVGVCRSNPASTSARRIPISGNQWVLDFHGDDREDATGFRLGDERFVPGEYVSILSGDGTTHTYCVERVADV